MEIVTGKAGVPHVSSADDGRRIAGEVGTGSYVLQTGGKLAPSLVDANTVRIAPGDMIVQGRHIGVTAPEDVKVASGSQGKKRMDYICVHYTRDVSGSSPTLVETVEWKVLQGTPGSSAAAPSVPKGSILDGDADVTVPICSVTFDGLTTGQPKLLIPELTPLADFGDSVSLTETNGFWKVRYACRAIRKMAVLSVHATRVDNNWVNAQAWERSQILAYPPDLAPVGGEFLAPAISSVSSGGHTDCLGFNVDSNGINVRIVRQCTIPSGAWVSGVLAWPIA